MLKSFKIYFSLVKFSHTIFALPFAIIGFFLGIHDCGHLNMQLLILIVLCMVLARNAAMAFNRLIDKDFDSANPRTRDREIPRNKISVKYVKIFILINSIFFCITTFFINKLCFYLSPVALITIFAYSYTKRFTFFSHLFLGLSLSLAPIGAYIAVCNQFSLLPIVLSLSVLFWVSGFDIIYALQDIDFDKKAKLKSFPSVFGFYYSKVFAILNHIVSIGFLIIFAIILNPQSYFYYIGLAIFIILILMQHYKIQKYKTEIINSLFFTYNGLASIIFGIMASIELYFF